MHLTILSRPPSPSQYTTSDSLTIPQAQQKRERNAKNAAAGGNHSQLKSVSLLSPPSSPSISEPQELTKHRGLRTPRQKPSSARHAAKISKARQRGLLWKITRGTNIRRAMRSVFPRWRGLSDSMMGGLQSKEGERPKKRPGKRSKRIHEEQLL